MVNPLHVKTLQKKMAHMSSQFLHGGTWNRLGGEKTSLHEVEDGNDEEEFKLEKKVSSFHKEANSPVKKAPGSPLKKHIV